MSKSRAHVYVSGKVQGVCFRASTQDKALMLGIRGWVKNCMDGGVEAIFEGEKDAVDKIVTWCKSGPPGALVKKLDVHSEAYTGEFEEFSIAYEYA